MSFLKLLNKSYQCLLKIGMLYVAISTGGRGLQLVEMGYDIALLRMFPADTTSELHVPDHDRAATGMQAGEVCVFEKTDKVSFGG